MGSLRRNWLKAPRPIFNRYYVDMAYQGTTGDGEYDGQLLFQHTCYEIEMVLSYVTNKSC